jgi:arsenical resistance protein ArsH
MTEECPRILKLLDAEERTLNPSNLPLPNDTHPKVTKLSDLVTWSGGIICCYPEHHGAMTGIIKTQID